MVRFNSSFCFSKIFSRERSSPPPPNFAPPFCAFCLIICDFLPKTWNLGRKEGKSALSGGAPLPSAPVGRSHLPQGDGLTLSVIAARCQIPPFVATRHLPPERGKSFLSGGSFWRCRKVSRHHQSRPLGEGGLTRSGKTEGVPPPVKMHCRAARRLPDSALIINNSSADDAQSTRGAHFKSSSTRCP